jgi:CheY-like chemotaxis protein
MGGHITVSSELTKGSAFRFEVPVGSGDPGAVTYTKTERPVIGLQAGRPGPRVLIVDDERNNRDWLNKLLTSIGFVVREAEDGKAAIELFEDWRPRLVLMDIRMPVMDGLEATRRMRSNPTAERAAIIALTASAMGKDRLAAIESGADDYLSKPCREQELLAMIRKYLGIEYVHAGEEPKTEPVESALGPRTELPAELRDALRAAIQDGDKHRLDGLIREVGERDGRSASVFRELAEKYEYEALSGLLEEVCR